jgi:hypothetical protein
VSITTMSCAAFGVVSVAIMWSKKVTMPKFIFHVFYSRVRQT